MKRKLVLAFGLIAFLVTGGAVMEVAKAQAAASAQAAGNGAVPKKA